MRILILGLNYRPESTSIGPYTGDLAESLLAAGHDVQVVTGFPMAPQWRVWDGYRGEWFRRERINGVPVRRSYLFVPANPRKTLNRVLFDSSFGGSSLLAAIGTGPCDVVVAVSPPLQAGLTGWIVSRIKGAPLFLHIQDLVPDAALATGMMAERGLAVRLAQRLERFIYRRAASIGVICEGFKRNLEAKGVPTGKIQVLPNHLDVRSIVPGERDGEFRRKWGIPASAFLAMYSGSMGLKQGLEILVDAADVLKHEPDVLLYVIGDGPSRAALVANAADRGLQNIRFLPLQPRETLAEQLAAADLLVITQRRSVMDIVFPGKLLYYMAAGRAILASVSAESETGRFITERGVGVVTPPEDPHALASAIVRLRREGTQPYGAAGRAVVERQFDASIVLPLFARHLESLARPSGIQAVAPRNSGG